ncbi:MAG: hypothetical protein ACTH0V_05170 [Microbacteriaceae bacterium]
MTSHAQVAAARELARRRNGRFGEQQHTDPEPLTVTGEPAQGRPAVESFAFDHLTPAQKTNALKELRRRYEDPDHGDAVPLRQLIDRRGGVTGKSVLYDETAGATVHYLGYPDGREYEVPQAVWKACTAEDTTSDIELARRELHLARRAEQRAQGERDKEPRQRSAGALDRLRRASERRKQAETAYRDASARRRTASDEDA